ncbi:hypothetical protein SeLEV6574_g05126 [Synchytrium endobioticum]|uniref:Uncharacterized protein n=1 Tax=Synchytrium endobioticum TaxID=286115 RepID=A0A507CW18_9FUNG|nr:hypothetical protein SeLEV6574_g05126 [Synchytrium endobioticum]
MYSASVKCWPPLVRRASLQDESLLCIAAGSATFSGHGHHKSSTTGILSVTTAKNTVNWILALFIACLAGVLTALMLYTASGYSAEVYGDEELWALSHFIRWLDMQLGGSEDRVLPT